MSFKDDLDYWVEKEREFAELLKKTMDITDVEFSQWVFKDYDIKITTPEWVKTYEIKSDRRAEETWNFVIEFGSWWHPSWITTSKADYIVYNIKWEWRSQDREILKQNLEKVKKRKVFWWDNNASEMRLIKCDYLPILFNKVESNEERWLPMSSTGDTM